MTNSGAYRRDIDGLRALAVLAVTIFHFGQHYLPGGFLGVDIFFVISGFLITSALHRSISSATFSFRDFYMRRIRRILPAFFVMLLVGLGLAWATFEPDALGTTSQDGFASAFFFANIHFAQGSGYFDLWSEERLFLHIWSLSIEEQYYFVFPILLLFLARVGRLWNHLFYILIALLLFLLSSALWFRPEQLGWDVYYLPHLRFAELLVGSLLAVAVERKLLGGGILATPLWRTTLSALALFVLIACMYYGEYFVAPWFPGVLALVPCVATAMLLYSNDSDTWVSRLFSLPIFVWVGKISYSLYLWHWLVLAYFRYFLGPGELGLALNAIAAALMLICSALSYYLVEQPLRHINWSFRRTALLLYALPALSVLLITKHESILSRIEALSAYVRSSDQISNAKPEDKAPTSSQSESKQPDWLDFRGDSTARASVLVAGDSHTWHLTAFVDSIGRHEGWRALHSSVSGTPFLFGYVASRSHHDPEAYKRLEYLSREYHKYDVVVLASAWGNMAYVPTDEDFLPALERTIKQLLAEGKQVIVLNSMYHVPPLTRANYSPWVARCLYRFKTQKSGMYYKYKANANRVKLLVERYPAARWIDLAEELPDDGLVDGVQIYRDATHINEHGAEFLAKRFLDKGLSIVER